MVGGRPVGGWCSPPSPPSFDVAGWRNRPPSPVKLDSGLACGSQGHGSHFAETPSECSRPPDCQSWHGTSGTEPVGNWNDRRHLALRTITPCFPSLVHGFPQGLLGRHLGNSPDSHRPPQPPPPNQHTPDCTLGESRPTDPHPTLQRNWGAILQALNDSARTS